MRRNFYDLRTFGENVPYVNREKIAALIKEELLPEIIQGTVEQSTVLRMGRRLQDMTTAQTRMPILDALPMAYFLQAEDGRKQTTTMEWKNKFINAEELAVIVPFSQSAADDTDYSLLDQITPRLVEAAGKTIDQAVLFGVNKPVAWPDGIVNQAETAGAVVSNPTNLYTDLLGIGGIMSKVEASGYDPNGHVAAIGVKAALRGLLDAQGRPLFVESMQSPGNFVLAGSSIYFPKNGAFDDSKALIITGDWNQLVYAIRQDVTIDVFTEGVVQNPDGSIAYNLMQNDMFAVRMVMRLGWEIPNPINGLNQTETRFPFALLKGSLSRGVSYNAPSGTAVAPVSSAASYTAADLNGMTVDSIKALASGLGYSITKSTKADIINEFVSQQAKG